VRETTCKMKEPRTSELGPVMSMFEYWRTRCSERVTSRIGNALARKRPCRGWPSSVRLCSSWASQAATVSAYRRRRVQHCGLR